MIVHDEESLNEALLLAESGPVRYVDCYAYIIITSADTLEARCRVALRRGDIVVVTPQGMEAEMESYPSALRRIRERRRRQERKDIREFFREHPEKVEKVEKYLKKREEKESGKS